MTVTSRRLRRKGQISGNVLEDLEINMERVEQNYGNWNVKERLRRES